MGANLGKTELAREYYLKYKFLEGGKLRPKLAIARILYAENEFKFKDVEEARITIQKLTGKSGETDKKHIAKDKRHLFEKEDRPRTNPYGLPESDEIPYVPHILDGNRIICLFDIHCPYHNIPALSAAIKDGKKYNPDTILLGGDAVDFYQVSDFVREKTKKQIVDELSTFAELIKILRIQYPKARIVFKEGNHEERYIRFLYQKAGELSGLEEFSLENIIKKRIGEIDYIGGKRIIKAGDLNIIHGHEFKGGISTPVNIARGLFLKAKVSCMQGHNHATSEHTETDMNGKITTTWSVGCLSELHPAYMPLNKWNHGFAFVEVDKSGEFQVTNKRIHKGEVL